MFPSNGTNVVPTNRAPRFHFLHILTDARVVFWAVDSGHSNRWIALFLRSLKQLLNPPLSSGPFYVIVCTVSCEVTASAVLICPLVCFQPCCHFHLCYFFSSISVLSSASQSFIL